MRPEGSTEKADLAVAYVLAQRSSSATEVARILSTWPPDKVLGKWRHPRSTIYKVLERFSKQKLVDKKRSGRSVIYSLRKPKATVDEIWERCKRRYIEKWQPRRRPGPQRKRPDERATGRHIGIERRWYLGAGYELATNIITKNERQKLAAEIADPKYEPRLYKLLCGEMVTTELENRALALLKRQSRKRRYPLPRRRPRIILRPYIDWKRNGLDFRGMTREKSY